jgi:CheY-like chemotaxis protein
MNHKDSKQSLSACSEVQDENAFFSLNTNMIHSQPDNMTNNETCEEPLISVSATINDEQRILIVDDQQFNIEAIIIILKYGLGIDSEKYCDFCFNGKQALEKIKNNVKENGWCQYNLILMDCNMPFMDGYEATQ